MTRIIFLFYLLFRWDILHRMLLVVGWCQILYSSGFLGVSSHYLILYRVSLWYSSILESVLQRLRADLWSGTKIPQVVCYGIKIKTNIQKWESKDEPQTNGSYKIRQIIIKIKEYAHIHIHSWAKSKQSNKNTVQLIGPANKENHVDLICSLCSL